MVKKEPGLGFVVAGWERLPREVRAGIAAGMIVVALLGAYGGQWRAAGVLGLLTTVVVAVAWLSARRFGFPRLVGPQKPMRERGGATVAVRQWPQLTEPPSPLSKALGGSTAEVWKKDAVSWTLRLELAPGRTVDEVQGLSGALESALDVRRGSLRVLPDERARRVGLRVISKDLLADPIKWSPPASRSITDPIRLGTFEDGDTCELRLLPAPGAGLNVALAGQPGSGKSGLLNALVAALARCEDVALAGVDPTGVELAPWEGCFADGLLALDAESAEDVLLRVAALIPARNRLLRQRGVRVWMPSREHPEVVLVVDEAAAVSKHMPLLDRIASQGRKDGIHIVAATQRPSAAALGDQGKEFLSKLQARIALRLSEAVDVDIALGRGAAREGWRSDLVCRRRGEFLIRSDVHLQPRVARGLLVTDSDVEAWAQQQASSRPRLVETQP